MATSFEAYGRDFGLNSFQPAWPSATEWHGQPLVMSAEPEGSYNVGGSQSHCVLSTTVAQTRPHHAHNTMVPQLSVDTAACGADQGMHGPASYALSSPSQSMQILDPFMKKASPTTPPASSAYTGSEKHFRFNVNALPFVCPQQANGYRADADEGGGRGSETKADAAQVEVPWTAGAPAATSLIHYAEAASLEEIVEGNETLSPQAPPTTVHFAEPSPLLQLRGIAHSVALEALSSPELKAAPAPTISAQKLACPAMPPAMPGYWLDEPLSTSSLLMSEALGPLGQVMSGGSGNASE
mmetsp:Transcript_68391/g.164150  ORF Transcript_68391/g.164150 Transcript_68391/m.164150 type:complete len:297 (-) Transcript_68391:51-941(-)